MLFLLDLIDEGVGEGEIENAPVPPFTKIYLHHRLGNDYSQELSRVSKIQLMVYHQFRVLIGWATSGL